MEMCDGSAFRPQLCSTTTMQPQARSDGSPLAGPVLATQLQPEEGSAVQGKEGPALHSLSCPPCPRVSPCSGVQGSLRGEDGSGNAALVGGPLLPPSLMVRCTARLTLLPCTVQANRKLPLVLSRGCSSSSIARYGHPLQSHGRKPGTW